MTKKEYIEWKQNNKHEFEQLSKECLESWIKRAINHELDDIVFRCPTVDKDRQIVTYRKILEAFIRKDDFCGGLYDELVSMYKEYEDYRKLHKQ